MQKWQKVIVGFAIIFPLLMRASVIRCEISHNRGNRLILNHVTLNDAQIHNINRYCNYNEAVYSSIQRLLGRNALLDGNLSNAQIAFEQAVKYEPRNQVNYLFLGEALSMQGAESSALDVWRQGGVENYFFYIGESYFEEHKLHEASIALQISLKIKPTPHAYLLQGQTFEALNRTDEAVEAYEFALELSPESPEILKRLGYSLFLYRKDEEAGLKNIDNALEIEPENAEAIMYKGIILGASAPQSSIVWFQRAIELNPAHVYSYLNLGDVLFKIGRYQEALEQFQIALELEPEHANANWQMGRYLWVYEENTEAAIPYFRMATSIQPQNQTYVGSLVLALVEQGMCQEAADEFRQFKDLENQADEDFVGQMENSIKLCPIAP